MKSKKLTDEQINLVYNFSKKINTNEISKKNALDILLINGVNRNSASDYCYLYTCLIEGKQFNRGISSRLLKIYLDNIYSDYGINILSNSLKSINEYLLKHSKAGKKLIKLHEVYNEIFKYYYANR